MKQFVGLYAVGSHSLTETNKPVFISELAVDNFLPQYPVFTPLGLMVGMKNGLYVGVVTFSDTGVEAKVLPFRIGSEELLKQTISEHLNQQCLAALDKMFSAGGADEEGEATPAYVNQDQS